MFNKIRFDLLQYLSLLLFAGFVSFTATAQEKNIVNNDQHSDYRFALVGLFVNDKEIANIDVVQNGKGYYLPLELFLQQIGVSPEDNNGFWHFHSPLGDSKISKSQVITFQNKQYLPLAVFKPLGVQAIFHQSDLAIKLYVPWNAKDPFNERGKNKTNKQATTDKVIDYYPETFGLGSISVNGGVNVHDRRDNTSENVFNLNVGMTGYLLGGLWGINTQYNTTQQSNDSSETSHTIVPDNFYWQTSGKNWATRLGTNTSSFDSGIGTYTGLAFAYSNQGIKKHLGSVDSASTQLLNGGLSSSGRTIKGTGPVGGIAELRINNRAIARVRIALDGKYEFIGLNINNYDSETSEVSVAVFEYSVTETPIKVDSPFLSRRHSHVSTNELMIEAGVGQQGNVFDDESDGLSSSSEVVGHLYTEYGLTNNIAVRSGLASIIDSDTTDKHKNTMVGVNVGLPFQMNADVSYQSLSDHTVYDSRLDYDGEYIDANYNYQQTRYDMPITISNALFESIDRAAAISSQARKKDKQHLNINIKPNERIRFGASGVHMKWDNELEDKYFTAYANARLHDNITASVHKDRDNDYRYGVNWSIPEWSTRMRANWDKESKDFSISKRFTPYLSAGVSTSHNSDENDVYHVYTDYQYNDKHDFHVGAGKSDGSNSYDLGWKYRPHEYALISLGYRKNQSYDEREIASNDFLFNDADYFYLQFNFDFINTHSHGIDFGRYHPSHYGTVIANVDVDDKQSLVLDNEIIMKLDDYSVKAYKLSDSQYQIENVKPGIYNLTFPTDSLPLEYQSNSLSQPVIKVSSAVPTVIDYNLEKTYGISGQLGSEKEDVLITVYNADKKNSETRTVAYGYFQIIGLPAGQYVLKSAGRTDKVVILTDEFLFEVEL